MYMLNANKQRIYLQPLETEVVNVAATRAVTVRTAVNRSRDPVNAAVLVATACRTHFDIGLREGKALAAELPQGPPPVAFRESDTGLLHVIYREVTLRFKPGVSQKKRNAILKKHNFTVRSVNPFIEEQVIVYHPERKYSGEKLLEVSNDISEMDEIVFAAPNFVSQFNRQATPAIRSEQWHLRNGGGGGATAGEDVDIRAAWNITTGRSNIVVAVLDDGVDIEHPNLRTRIWKNPDSASKNKVGRDFFLRDDDPDHFNPRPKLFRDPFDQMAGNDIHGTPCAGVVAAPGSSGGAIGAAPGCRVLAVKVFHADDLAPSNRVADAIRFAASIADVLSCSWSGGSSPDIQLALADAGTIGRQGKGSAVFCAAGNNFGSPVSFPARDTNAIAVGASTDQARIADYSNVGPQIAMVAPSSGGVRGIFTADVSTANRGFNVGRADRGGVDGLHTNNFGGTSSATPLTAGVAALVLSANPNLTRTDLRDVLTSTAEKIGSGYDANGHSNQFGFGRIDAGRAVAAALSLGKAAKKAVKGASRATGSSAKKAAASRKRAKKSAKKNQKRSR
ncbi:MAG: S8 family serine peptidase [Pyrinomonadaceae bacterium]